MTISPSLAKEPAPSLGQAPAPATIHPVFAEFREKEVEQAYREEFLHYDARQVMIFVGLFLPVAVVFVVSDFRLFEETRQLGALMLARLLILLLGVVTFAVAWRRIRSTELDIATFAFVVTGLLANAYIDSTRPADYMGHYIYDVIAIMAVYYAFPIPIRFLMFANLIFTAALFWLLYGTKVPPQDLYWTLVPICLVLANLFGFLGARRIRIYHREQFVLLRSERTARMELQEAMERIRTLSGLIPICATCKKIRDDKGFWNQLETYVSKHSSATFTHGICPDCSDKYHAMTERPTPR